MKLLYDISYTVQVNALQWHKKDETLQKGIWYKDSSQPYFYNHKHTILYDYMA